MTAKNKYAEKSKQKGLLGIPSMSAQQTKGDIKGSLLETGKDLVIGVIGGGVAGAVVGRASLILGVGVTLASYYMGSKEAAMFGVGMMAANGFQKMTGTVSGIEDQNLEGFEGIKDRVMTFKDTFSQKLWLDKILKKTDAAKPTNGLGDVQYFTYPQQEGLPVGDVGEIDLSALDRIEQQIKQQAKSTPAVSGAYSDESMGSLDDDRLY